MQRSSIPMLYGVGLNGASLNDSQLTVTENLEDGALLQIWETVKHSSFRSRLLSAVTAQCYCTRQEKRVLHLEGYCGLAPAAAAMTLYYTVSV